MKFKKQFSLTAAIVTVVCLSLLTGGCRPDTPIKPVPQTTIVEQTENHQLATPEGMIDYLADLPPVFDVTKWENQYGPGITITTRHYEIHTTMLEPLILSRVPGFMESALTAYQKQLPKPVETNKKFTVYLFADRRQWEDFTKEFTGENAEMYLKIKKGAYYLNGACVAYNIGRTRIFSVLGHEGWHQFNSRHFVYRLPSWLDEGLATMFESSRYEDGFFYFVPQRNGGRLVSLKKLVNSGKFIPLGKLLTLNPGEVVASADIEAVMAFYAQSYALIRFLKEDDYGINLMKFQNMLLDAKNGKWPLDRNLSKLASDRNVNLTVEWNRYVSPKLFEYYIDNHKSLQENYFKFCRKIVYNIHLKPDFEAAAK